MYKTKTIFSYATKLRDCIVDAKQPLFEVGVDIIRYFLTRKKGRSENEIRGRDNHSAQSN